MVQAVSSIFLPPSPMPVQYSSFEGDPQRERKERSLLAYTVTRWYQRDVEEAIGMADNGDLAQMARLCRSMRRDGFFGGVLSTRTGGLMRCPKLFRGTDRVVSCLDSSEDGMGLFDRVFSVSELEKFVGDIIVGGVAYGRLIPLPDRPEPVFVRFDPEFLRYQWGDDRWYFRSVGGPIHIVPGDGSWIMYTGGIQNPWQHAPWAALARAYIAKDHAFHYRENYSSQLANPARVAKSPLGTGEKERASFFRKLMQWGINTAFALPNGWDIELIESNGRGYEVFGETMKTADAEFMVCLAGQTMSTTGGTGFANGNLGNDVRWDLIQRDGDAVSETLNQQGLRQIVNRMFGRGERGTMKWDTKQPEDLKADADAITACMQAIEAANAQLKPYGMRVDVREMVTRYKVPVVVMSAPEAAPAQLPGERDVIDPPTDESASSLASKMTQYRIPRCEHGSLNRCRLCGVERVRDFAPGEDGSPSWSIAWRPIARPTSPPQLSVVRNEPEAA